VTGVNAIGESAPSSEVSATPNAPPRVTSPASANPSPVNGTSTILSVSGASNDGESLSYAWALTSKPTGANPSFSTGGSTKLGANSDSSNSTTVTFDVAGTYTFLVTLATPSGLTGTSSVTLVVNQTESQVSLSPPSATVNSAANQQFTATALDQFGHTMASQPAFAWSVDSGGAGGTITGAGLYTAPATTAAGAVDTVRASDALTSGAATVTVVGVPAAPSNLVATSFSPTQINVTWSDNATSETSYSVERSTNGTSWSVIATLAARSTSYSSTGLTSGSTYYYRVRCFNGSLASSYSNTASAVAAYGAPAAPSQLATTAVSSSQINLSWTDNATNATAYEVLRSTNGTTWTVLVSNLAATAISYSDTKSLIAATTYSYEVLALNHTVASAASNVATAATGPTAPAGLTGAGTYNSANPALGAINLVWQDKATAETGYSVERSTDNKTWSVIASLPANSTSYSDTSLTLAATYDYRVRCFNGVSPSSYSSSISVVATPTAPAQPGGLTAKVVSSSQINLAWQDKAINETGYIIQRSTDSKTWSVLANLPANSTSYSDPNLNPSTKYYYRVQAVDGSLSSAFTNSVSATTTAGSKAAGPVPDANITYGLPTVKASFKKGSFWQT
jgi:hypothetical protein